MIQKNYVFKNPDLAAAAVGDIMNTISSHPHRDVLLTFYESGFTKQELEEMIDAFVAVGFPRNRIAGISVFALADTDLGTVGVRLNLLISEDAAFQVVTIPCEPGGEVAAATIMRKKIDADPKVKAVGLFACNLALDNTTFLTEAMHSHEDVGVFGTMTSRHLPHTMLSPDDGQFSFIPHHEDYFDENQWVVGDLFLPDGYVAILFSGENLYAAFSYALGWHAIGREMEITLGERGQLGESTVTEIDGMRAVDLFKEYLGVDADHNLTTNICEFPFLIRQDDMDVCVIPFDYGENGEVYFNRTLHADEKLRFSFATHDDVLHASMEACETMDHFDPQALFMIICGNRFNFLKEEAALEWECFAEHNPDFVLMHGASEIYYQYGKGGILNSAHVTVGFREGDAAHVHMHDHEELIETHTHHVSPVPLAERMSVFLNKMTCQLLEVARDAQSANQAKSAFLSNMSHEIRTPINAILGMDEMILRESGEPEIVRYAENIRSAGNSLLGIVNDVLDFSKIEAGKMDIIPVEYEFSSVINDLYNLLKKRAEDKGLTLNWEIDPAIPSILYGDEIRLKQVITNIMTNAVKYTEKGSVTLSVSKESKEKALEEYCLHADRHGLSCMRNPVTLRISVRDTGIGIKESDRKRLFSAFERVDEERNRTIEGTGLGLNITNRLLHLMGSHLTVESTYGEGSDFAFSIIQGIVRDEPIGDINERFAQFAKTHKTYHENFHAPDARILVVDDTKMNLDVIVSLLKKTKIRIDTAESGAESLEMVTRTPYDMIFLDHRMPHMDGVECFERMKKLTDHKSPDAPVISLTANAVSGARDEYLSLGFTDYLTKPIDSEKLERMLMRYLPSEKVVVSENEDAPDEAPAEEESVLPAWLQETESLDASGGVKNCGSVDGFLSALDSFCRTIDDKASELQDYFDSGDWENYTIKVHALKSSARIVGASELSSFAAGLEAAGDAGDIETIRNHHAALMEQYRSFKDTLRALSKDEGELPEAPEAEVRDAYQSIAEFAGMEDYELVKMVLDSMNGYKLADSDQRRFDELYAKLSKLDWEGIVRFIEEEV